MSILAMTTVESSLKCSPSSSQIGASFLQWPHLEQEQVQEQEQEQKVEQEQEQEQDQR